RLAGGQLVEGPVGEDHEGGDPLPPGDLRPPSPQPLEERWVAWPDGFRLGIRGDRDGDACGPAQDGPTTIRELDHRVLAQALRQAAGGDELVQQLSVPWPGARPGGTA